MKAIEANRIAGELNNAYNDMDEASPEYEIVKARIAASAGMGKFDIEVPIRFYRPEQFVVLGNTMQELYSEGYGVSVYDNKMRISWARFLIGSKGDDQT